MFAALLGSALMRGKAGAPCACFGSRSTIGPLSVLRNLALAAGFAALPLLPADDPSTDEWLALGLGVALAACAGLGDRGPRPRPRGRDAAPPARDAGRARDRRRGAGRRDARSGARRAPRLRRPRRTRPRRLHLGGLPPLPDARARDRERSPWTRWSRSACSTKPPSADLWRELAVPGSPFAVAPAADGTVLAKGTFNNLAQLESVLATADRRRREGTPDAADSGLGGLPIGALTWSRARSATPSPATRRAAASSPGSAAR